MALAAHINGTAPSLAGRVCRALICQQFVADGKLEDGANVTFLRFDDEWFRLYFEPGLIFWRSGVETPYPWDVPETQERYPHVDIGTMADVAGRRLNRYDMWASHDASHVLFEFENAKRILIEHENDRGRYIVT